MVKVLAVQLCLTLCDPMDWSLPDPFVHGNLQAKILKWVAVPFSRVFSQPWDPAQVSSVSCIASGFLTVW